MNITVIVATHNRCESLAQVLKDLVEQEMPSSVTWEILVVDNNSTDKTRSVVEAFSRKYSERFRYVLETEQGKSYALNTGIRETQSEILAFTDDDVIVDVDWLWNLTSNLLGGEWVGSGGRIVPVWAKPIPRWLSTEDPQTMGPFVAFEAGSPAGPLRRPPYGANAAYCRVMFEKYGGFRVDLSRSGSSLQGREDIEFANRLLAAGEPLRYEPHAVVRHPASEHRMKKTYVLNWWFRYGYLEVMDTAPDSSAKYSFQGVPLCLFRRLTRWSLQWMISIRAPRRFASRRNAWYLAGVISARYRRARSRDRGIAEIPKISHRQQDHSTRQTGAAR
jgi:glycosyltransferase involved in cell wall biosynthesis